MYIYIFMMNCVVCCIDGDSVIKSIDGLFRKTHVITKRIYKKNEKN